MTPRRMKWRRDGTSPTPKPIDLRLEGLGDDDRLQLSSGTTLREAYERRVNAIKEAWGKGGVWRQSVLSLHAKRFGVTEWMAARDAGVDAVELLIKTAGAEPLVDVISDYLRSTRAADRAKMRQRLDRLVVFLGGPKRATIADLTTAHVDAFLSQLTDQRTAKTTATPAQGSTINRYRAVISGLATFAVRQARLAVHPVAGKKIEKREEPHHRLPEMTPAEYASYTSHISVGRPDLLVVLLLLIHTGADVGEVFTLTMRDVDFEAKRIRYQRTKTRHHATASAPRFVPMPSIVAAELRAHIDEHQLWGSNTIFSMLARSEVEWIHARAAKAVARPELTMKDLRHVAAIAWVKAGVHIRLVQRWLGHASLSMTMKYTDYEPEAAEYQNSAERAADTLNRVTITVPLIPGFIPNDHL